MVRTPIPPMTSLNPAAMRLLVIEDEPDLRKSLLRLLREEGYAADGASDGVEGLHKATEWDYDAILLDYQLPGMDGREVLRRLRKTKRTPVVMLTAHNSIDDRVTGLDLGADDFVAKPYEESELLARIRSVIRRNHRAPGSYIKIGEITVDTASRRVTKGGAEALLTAREYAVLEYLAHRRGALVTRAELHEHLFDENDDTMSNLLEVHVCNLRRKLNQDIIKTRRGQGYIIDSPEAA